jgi:hypothetical protein
MQLCIFITKTGHCWHADIDPFEILVVDPRYLRAEDELRRIFGSKVINAVEKGGDGVGMLGGRKRQQPHGGGRVSLKKTLLVTPHDHWPRPEGGLSMECIDTKDGVNFFRCMTCCCLHFILRSSC